MPDRRPLPLWTRLGACLVALVVACPPAVLAQSDSDVPSSGAWDISELLERLPSINPFDKLNVGGPVPLRFYSRPHLGDFIRRDYIRVPVGFRAHVTDHVEVNGEAESYLTHGIKDSAGYGFSKGRVGLKYDEVISAQHPIGWSVGTDFESPLDHPPAELTDGHRHLVPYLSFSKVLSEHLKVIGYTSLSANFVSHSPLAPNFGRNQLHTNSNTLTAGVTRDYTRFRVALTGNWSSSALLSDENHHVFSFRPDIIIPLTKTPEAKSRTHLLVIFGGRAVHGPDGTELGVNGSVRIEFAVRGGKK